MTIQEAITRLNNHLYYTHATHDPSLSEAVKIAISCMEHYQRLNDYSQPPHSSAQMQLPES